MRWRLRLSEIYYHIDRRAGIKNEAVGALFRLETQGKNDIDIDDDNHIAIIDVDKDGNQTKRVPVYTVCHMSSHKDRKLGTMISEIQLLVE